MIQANLETIPVVTHCPLQATSFAWRASSGRGALTVACKVTYELSPGVSHLAEDQEPIHLADVHWQDEERNSLKAPSDRVPFKPRVDVLVTGHVHAPHGQSVRSLFARVVVGEVNKTIAVYGDRRVLPGGELSEPGELERMPLCWERAAGGPGTSNPVGVAFSSAGGPVWAPNFQPPGIYVGSTLDGIPPAGLGPLSPSWPDRLKRLGRAAATWDDRAWYANPLPEGLDAAYFHSAPADQQMAYLAPDERIVLENLHPEHPRLVTKLDGVVPRARLRRAGQSTGSIELRCDTLWIDTDRGLCCVTWRGTVGLDSALGTEVHITADGQPTAAPSPAESTVWSDAGLTAPLPFSAAGSAVSVEVEKTAQLPSSAAESTLWIEAESSAQLRSSAAESTVWVDESRLATALRRAQPPFPPAGPPPPSLEPEAADTTVALVPRAYAAETAPLPFAPAAPGASARMTPTADTRERPASPVDSTATILAPLAPATPELPRGWSGARPLDPPAAGAAPPPPALLAPVPAPSPVFSAPVPPPFMGAIAPGHEPAAESLAETDALTERPPPPRAPAPMSAVAGSSASRETPAEPSLLAPAVALGKSQVEAPLPAIDPDVFTIERWAEVAAELDKAPRPRADILGDHDMTDREFVAADRHWKEVLASEATTGGFSLRFRHDVAYVGALERLRGRPITASEYAQIVSAGDRRRVVSLLQSLEMPAAAHLPIARQWTVKLARDAGLSLEMIQVVAALRENAGESKATS